AQYEARERAEHQGSGGSEHRDLQAHERGIADRLVLPELDIPTHREARPDRHQPGSIEGTDDQRGDRAIEEQVAEAEHGPRQEGAGGQAGSAETKRRISAIGSARSASIATATAEAAGQSWFSKNSSQSTLPIISVSGPPSSSGITNSPTAGMNTSREPAAIPGEESGKVTERKARQGRAPRSAAASSRIQSSFSSCA